MAASNPSQEPGPGAAALTREQLLALAKTTPEVLVELVLAMQEQIRALTLKVARLEACLAQNSANSHRPPGSDGSSKPPAPKSLRGRSGRRPGAQPGHPGHTLRQVEAPDHTLVHTVETCPCGQRGGGALAGEPLLGYEARPGLLSCRPAAWRSPSTAPRSNAARSRGRRCERPFLGA